ncbi:choice-of-anchor L domain-containing protein [Ichthyenterobacterium sp. W332]|uniref:Choice-of-anchor L domain-containing protein n=1 Tax=Microcosmobacter mediterraneus TaxID=3075607 RepID=A0ABU2YFY1_9FLAO|nr:choice-of-anchor L domain-containing protein [Ichthyenterobacterium sp. W332]MDT0557071.1 choice-of-anchor L domain-containing protein [Ichthyenterobacterium sp. W332]
MKKKSLLLLISTFCCALLSYAQQISTTTNTSLQELIESNFGQGCVEISNISSSINGNVIGLSSYGFFERAGSEFPFQDGIVLTTGNANSAGNVLTTSPLNDGDLSWGTDTDLETALGIDQTLNATSIQFDFVSVANQIQFNYILASEEYQQEFPCFYSDGFAFLIREAGTNNPFTNIALVPGTTIPVNTNTVHEEIVEFCPAENPEYFDGYNVGDTNYNGRTVVLSATASIEPNVQYQIKLVIADQGDQNYDSAVFIEGNSFEAVVDLGPDIETCASSVTLNGDIENDIATYEWFLNDTSIAGETNTTLVAETSGTYKVEVSIPINNSVCIIEDEVVIALESEQAIGEITDIVTCDDPSNDGVDFFIFTDKTDEIIALLPVSDYTITYHSSETDAENGTNAIGNFYQNVENPQTIYVRVVDNTSGCLAFGEFNLIVNLLPEPLDLTPIQVCEAEDATGAASFFLEDITTQVTANNPNLIVSYHFSETEAEFGLNPIPSPYDGINPTQQLFVRIINLTTGCISVSNITLAVISLPNINTEDLHWIDACEIDDDGFEVFDITSEIDDILQGTTGVNVSYHELFVDAQTGDNPIPNPENFQNNTLNLQIIFVRVEDQNTGCVAIVQIELHTDVTETGFNLGPLSICDNPPFDDIADVDLTNITDRIIGEYTNDYTFTYYLTENDQLNDTNAVDTSMLFTVTDTETFFIRVVRDGCEQFITVDIEVNQAIDIEPLDLEYCDDETSDGIVSIDLNSFNLEVIQGTPAASVNYYLTEDDAIANENDLDQFFTNFSNPQQLWVRVVNTQTDCSDVEPISITIVPLPEVTLPTDIFVCLNHSNDIAMVDLEENNEDIVTDPSNFNFTYYEDFFDAEIAENEISSPSNFNAITQTVYTRVEHITTGCFSIVEQNIIVSTLPTINVISDFENCQGNIANVTEFLFSEKDDEILNGQIDMEVLYFETELDAENNTNPIDKFTDYQNTSSPQTIYVRVQNVSDENCFNTASFDIRVGSLPIFNPPSDIFECDDPSNDELLTVDLSEKIDEISNNTPLPLDISFHESLIDAEDNTNAVPLTYTNSVNPQQLFTRIDNGTNCVAIASFEINVIQVPVINEALPLEVCDVDYDGQVVFDITQIEFEILNVRQDNIVVSYHLSQDDAEANENEIPNPENYANISNPQTVYIRITNTISTCYRVVPLDLIVNLPPEINTFSVYEICDNDTNTFDLTTINNVIVNDSSDTVFSYYLSEDDAQNQVNALDTNYTYITSNDQLFARVEFSTTNCFITYPFELMVNPRPEANQPPNLEACDDDFDGFLVFDLSAQNTTVLGSQNPLEFAITYHNTEANAIDGINSLDTNYSSADDEDIYVRVTNNETGCFEITNFLITVRPRPDVAIPDQVICLDNLPLIVSADTGNVNDVYIWSTGSGATEIQITEIGTYSVTVTSEYGCQTTSTFNVIESEPAMINVVETVDFSDPNNITITISGIGNYLYQLDDGVPQESNVFQNVTLGYHTITIIDLNGCSEVTREVVVVDAPKFFTPNGDTIKETWHIAGVETLPGTTIYIFDRYGKQIAYLTSTSRGWDGTYNGNNMPATDYWFLANVVKNGIQFEVKGHFTLRR